jgi:hypothetical protein
MAARIQKKPQALPRHCEVSRWRLPGPEQPCSRYALLPVVAKSAALRRIRCVSRGFEQVQHRSEIAHTERLRSLLHTPAQIDTLRSRYDW